MLNTYRGKNNDVYFNDTYNSFIDNFVFPVIDVAFIEAKIINRHLGYKRCICHFTK